MLLLHEADSDTCGKGSSKMQRVRVIGGHVRIVGKTAGNRDRSMPKRKGSEPP